jgi:hypothetical protein
VRRISPHPDDDDEQRRKRKETRMEPEKKGYMKKTRTSI